MIEDLVKRLRETPLPSLGRIARDRRDAADEIDRLRADLREWEECAIYDATMEGPVFKAWDRSALDRRRRASTSTKETEG